MMRAVLMTSCVIVTVLAAGPASWAQPAAADNDVGFVLPTDGLFDMPPDVSWLHDVIAFWWLLPMIFVSGTVLWIVQWVDGDARRVGIQPVGWNAVDIALALVSLGAFFLLPAWLSLPAVLAAFLVVAWNYIPKRNVKVLPTRQLFTADHRQALKRRVLGTFGIHPMSAQKRLARIAREHVPVAVFDARGRMVSAADAPFDETDPITEIKEIVGQAGRRHAREVEVRPKDGRIAVSYLIDGLMHAGPTFDRLHGGAAMVLLKRDLIDPASSSSRFRIQLPTLDAAFTVQVCPCGEGDAAWMRLRLVRDDEQMRRFGQLGLSEAQASVARSALDSGRGLVAVTSPAGLGARTAIYAMLDTLDPFSRTIITYERPVAGKLESVQQQDLPAGAALAAALTEVVRKEIDLVMLSEVPDAAAANIALTAAARDQMFLARFELPDVSSVPGRLIRLGVKPETVAAGLHTLVAQRLVRRLCPACRRQVPPPAAVFQRIGVDVSRVEFLYEESTGCDECGQTGFHGRTGIFEVWQPSADSRRLIERNVPAEQLHAAALRDGMKSLQHSGLALVLEGVTSLRELARALKIV